MHYTFILSLAAILVLLIEIVMLLMKKKPLLRIIHLPSLMIIIVWLAYLFAFIGNDLSLKAVYENTAEGMSTALRIAASWASGEGAFLYVSLCLAMVVLVLNKRYDLDAKYLIWSNVLLLLFILLTSLNGAFEQTGFKASAGLGLNPLLKNKWMYIHPVLSLLAYGVTIATIPVLLARLNHIVAVNLLRIGWILVTGALFTGAYWSYTTFGWGGYWAWDPVETAQLILWIAITISLHSISMGMETFRFGGFISGASVYLALFITRVGISPLHGFANTRELTGVALIVVLFYLLYLAFSRTELVFSEIKRLIREKTPLNVGTTFNLAALFIAFLFLFSSLLVPSVLVLAGKSVSAPMGDSAIRIYHPVLLPIVLLVLVSMPLCSIGRRYSWRTLISLLLGASIVSFLFVYLTYQKALVWSSHSSLSTNIMISLLVPFSSLSLASIIIYLAQSLRQREFSRLTSVTIAHLGIVLVVIGVLLSGPYAYSKDIFKTSSLQPGESLDLQGADIKLEEYSYSLSDAKVSISMDNYDTTINQYAAYAQYLMATELTQIVSIIEKAENKLENNGTKWMLENQKIEAVLTNNSYPCVAVLEDNTTENCVIELNDIGVFPLANLEGTMISVQLLLIGNISLTASERVYQSLINNGVLTINMTVYNPEIKINNTLLESPGFTILTFNYEQHMFVMPRYIDGKIIIEGSTLIPINGHLKIGEEYHNLPLTINDPQIVMYYALLTNEDLKSLINLLRSVGLYGDFAEGKIFKEEVMQLPASCMQLSSLTTECLAPFKFSIVVPESAYLDINLLGENKMYKSSLRFDVSGEVKGIHGLVPRVVTIRKGLSDVYIVVTSPIYLDQSLGFSISYPDLMVYYVSMIKGTLSNEDILRLCTLLASGYYSGAPNIGPVDIVYLSIVLYSYASSYSSVIDKTGLPVQYKYIPGVNLVWIGGIVLVVGELLLMISKYLFIERKTNSVEAEPLV
jgi:cytochrome c-type biogenesis protein CcmF